MRIQIIGLGIVGTAQACLSQKLGHDVIGYDIRQISSSYCKVKNGIVKDTDIIFICTPESVIEGVIHSLVEINYSGIITIRSTVPIGTIKHMSEKFGVHICHNPEFLREEHYLEDIMNPNVVIIGECCQTHGDLLETFYRPINKQVIRVDTTHSELIKLTNNAYLSVLITFWNEIDELCHKMKIRTEEISDIISYDPRISSYGCEFFGIPYGGKCLPKDIRHLIEGFRCKGLNPKLFEACESFNGNMIEKEKALKTRDKKDQQEKY